MNSISVDMVLEHVQKILGGTGEMNYSLIQLAPDYWICPDFADDLKAMGLDSLESVFAFEGGKALVKKELTPWRSRTEFVLPGKNIRCFLKRYTHPPMSVQIP